MVTADRFIDELRSWAGTPFVHGQAKKGVGVDCLGLFLAALNNCGITQYGTRYDYPPFPDNNLYPTIQSMFTQTEKKEPGALLVFNTPKNPEHVGIYTGDGNMIHAWIGTSFVAETIIDLNWSRRLNSVWMCPAIGGKYGD